MARPIQRYTEKDEVYVALQRTVGCHATVMGKERPGAYLVAYGRVEGLDPDGSVRITFDSGGVFGNPPDLYDVYVRISVGSGVYTYPSVLTQRPQKGATLVLAPPSAVEVWDRRREMRKPLHVRAYLTHELHGEVETWTEDFSSDGLGILSPVFIPENTLVEIRGAKGSMQGYVRMCRKAGDVYRVGVQFSSHGENHEEAIGLLFGETDQP
jgi:hypothetical protein